MIRKGTTCRTLRTIKSSSGHDIVKELKNNGLSNAQINQIALDSGLETIQKYKEKLQETTVLFEETKNFFKRKSLERKITQINKIINKNEEAILQLRNHMP